MSLTLTLSFRRSIRKKSLAGKPAVFKVKLHEIKKRELPEIDDEFAKDVSEFDTLNELKEDIKKKALERKETAADDDVENELINQLIDNMTAEIPEAMYERRVEDNIRDF